MSTTPESKTMRECFTTMVNGLAAGDVDAIADDLLGHNLIAGDVHEGLELQTKTKSHKARDVLRNVSAKVNGNPKENFTKFLDVLRKHEGMEHLVKTLEDKYRELCGLESASVVGIAF